MIRKWRSFRKWSQSSWLSRRGTIPELLAVELWYVYITRILYQLRSSHGRRPNYFNNVFFIFSVTKFCYRRLQRHSEESRRGCGVTRVGVTRGGNSRCRPIFSWRKTDDLFSHRPVGLCSVLLYFNITHN